MGKCSWQGSTDDDFERKLLMHCETHAHEYDSIVDTTFDDDEDEDGINSSFSWRSSSEDGEDASFTMIHIGEEEHIDPPSDVNIVSNDPTSDVNIVSVIQEEETGVEVVMQRYCVSCAMDVTDVMGQCPFCVAAKKFDFNFEDDSNSSSLLGLGLSQSHSIEHDANHDREQLNSAHLSPSAPVLLTPSAPLTPIDRGGVKGKQSRSHSIECDDENHESKQVNTTRLTPSTPALLPPSSPSRTVDRRKVKRKQKSKKLLKGMIVGFLEENKNAQGQQPTKISPTPESRDDTSLLTKPKTSAMHDDAPTSLRELNVNSETTETDEFLLRSVSQRLHEVNNVIHESNMLVESSPIESQAHMTTQDYGLNDVDATAVRSQLMLLENHYSKQERRRRRHLTIY